MEKKVIAKAFYFSGLTFLIFILSWLLFGCATSRVSREVAANTDHGIENAKKLFYGGSGNIADRYQNTSETTKGAVIGGALGALIYSLYPGVGFVPATATGVILGASYGSYLESEMTFGDQLENRGVLIIRMGDHVLIMLPSARLFEAESAVIKPNAYDTLYLLVNYINHYTTTLVKVTAYTNQMGDGKKSLWLSEKQSAAISKFLTDASLNTRVIASQGKGATAFIEHPGYAHEESDNNRIEITFRQLYR